MMLSSVNTAVRKYKTGEIIMNFDIDKEAYEKIAEMIHSDKSPVGIDAKKTHILILHKLMEIEKRLDALEKK